MDTWLGNFVTIQITELCVCNIEILVFTTHRPTYITVDSWNAKPGTAENVEIDRGF